ncbi:hypothetical protein AMJ83_02740 [candidate division WOR_3 bacterium SM23_42]|uniref:RNA polymerase subunit sigma-24 n=1 Tax=candidate division WOR_3 bacterium SM23_42 TaxID=1703779 RepID=A0A0S8FUI3_UNCW3|nr:MAG: hypothetical protein AMJ83_02740 [candidate division WOR_3 bacterium SM23_42]
MKDYPSLHLRKDLEKYELRRFVDGAKKGDEDALSQLCVYVYSRIYSYVFYRVNQPEDAEDLTSEVVLKVIKALKNQRGNFHAWMYKIAKHALIDFYRKKAVRRELSLSDLSHDIADKSADFSRQTLTRERLRKGMQRLTEEQRQVIILRFIEGFSNSEAAEFMGKSVGAIKVLQFRALRALRDYFSRQGYEDKN